MPGRYRHVIAVVTVAGLSLGACATGERPELVAPPSTTGDPAAAAVLERLGRWESATFTATYDIIPTLTGETTTATVVQSGNRRRTVIGTVEYTRNGPDSQTCFTGDVDCAPGLDDARVSNLNITHEFWGRSAAARLNLDSGRSIAAATGRTETIAGVSATCADIIVPASTGAGTIVYCATDAGLLARYIGADVRIELTSFVATADEALLTG